MININQLLDEKYGFSANFHLLFQQHLLNNKNDVAEEIIHIRYGVTIKKFIRIINETINEIIGVIQFQTEKSKMECEDWFHDLYNGEMKFVFDVTSAGRTYLERKLKLIKETKKNSIYFKLGERRVGGETLIKSNGSCGRNLIYFMLKGENAVFLKSLIEKKMQHKLDFPELRKAAAFYQEMKQEIDNNTITINFE